MIDEQNARKRTIQQNKRKSGTLVYSDLVEAHNYFDEKCPYSGTPINEKNWHLEHIIPVIMGGTTDSWNCIVVCGPCNLSKGGMHLLDWWDQNHLIEEEYKLEKIFQYIIHTLNKPRIVKVSTKEEIEKLKKIEENEFVEEDDIEFTKELDTFSFLYQLLAHLANSKQISKEKLKEYSKLYDIAREKNKEFKMLDIKLARLQSKFTKYLKAIGVVKHYKISFEYADKIDNLDIIKENVNNIRQYLNMEIGNLIDNNPELLFMNIDKFKNNYEYLLNEIKIPKKIILSKPILLNDMQLAKEFYEICIENNFDINKLTEHTFKRGNLKQFIKILKLQEFKAYPHLFTSTVLAHSTPERIQEIIASEEFKAYPHLFTSQVLAHSTPERIQEIIASEEFKAYPHLFKSTVLAHSTPERIQEIIASEEFKAYPDLFTSTVLAHSTPERIQEIIASEEFKAYPHLFTSQVLAHSTPERIQEIIASEEFKAYPDLFTSEVLAHSTPERIQEIIASEEFKAYPDLFTSEVLARSTPERIQEIINMEIWKDDKYSHLLSSTILAKIKRKESILSNIKLAEQYGFEKYITTNYLIKSPTQNFALIKYLLNNSMSIVETEKLNSIFSYMPGVLLKKYGIDLKELIKIYNYEESEEQNVTR